MLNISGLSEGVVLDHIQAGKSMDIYRYLNLDRLECQIAIIKNGSLIRSGTMEDVKGDSSLEDVFLELVQTCPSPPKALSSKTYELGISASP